MQSAQSNLKNPASVHRLAEAGMARLPDVWLCAHVSEALGWVQDEAAMPVAAAAPQPHPTSDEVCFGGALSHPPKAQLLGGGLSVYMIAALKADTSTATGADSVWGPLLNACTLTEAQRTLHFALAKYKPPKEGTRVG